MGCQNENDFKIEGGVLISLTSSRIFGFFRTALHHHVSVYYITRVHVLLYAYVHVPIVHDLLHDGMIRSIPKQTIPAMARVMSMYVDNMSILWQLF
jgi:hypothetical protein